MHKLGNELFTLINGLGLTINVSCTAWNVKYFKASRSDITLIVLVRSICNYVYIQDITYPAACNLNKCA